MTSTRRAGGTAKPAPEQPHHHLPTGPGDAWSGQDLKRAVTAATAWLIRNADTGTNMALTMQTAVRQVADSPGHSASEIAVGISRGALMGARGNSGVILSQIWRGFAEGIAGKDSISARDFAEGLVTATSTSYRAVLQPVEGTILTVMREMGEAAQAAASALNSYEHMLGETCMAASASVARTPTLHDKLLNAGRVA